VAGATKVAQGVVVVVADKTSEEESNWVDHGAVLVILRATINFGTATKGVWGVETFPSTTPQGMSPPGIPHAVSGLQTGIADDHRSSQRTHDGPSMFGTLPLVTVCCVTPASEVVAHRHRGTGISETDQGSEGDHHHVMALVMVGAQDKGKGRGQGQGRAMQFLVTVREAFLTSVTEGLWTHATGHRGVVAPHET
jgi:hypothetical protein